MSLFKLIQDYSPKPELGEKKDAVDPSVARQAGPTLSSQVDQAGTDQACLQTIPQGGLAVVGQGLESSFSKTQNPENENEPLQVKGGSE